jgi:hypothetical protein
MSIQLTTAQFIQRAHEVHGDKYDYCKSVYAGNGVKTTIICKEHGEFLQTPGNHIWRKSKCPSCTGNRRLMTNDFIQRSQQVHGLAYNYTKTSYKSLHSQVIIICKEHGEFFQTPNSHLHRKSGCPSCAGNRRLTTAEFIVAAQHTHGKRYDYTNTTYVSSSQPIIIGCKIHGDFRQTPDNHIYNKSGCTVCNKPPMTTEKIIERANIVHNGEYDYSAVAYVAMTESIVIICKKHGRFKQMIANHIDNKTRCPRCAQQPHSLVAISWLDYISNSQGLIIQHAKNVGEYIIPNTRISVDGYCSSNNTAYEFYGDYWHGNPEMYVSNHHIQVCNKTAGELYQKTVDRAEKIRTLGYNLVEIWESDWNKLKKQLTLEKQNGISKSV